MKNLLPMRMPRNMDCRNAMKQMRKTHLQKSHRPMQTGSEA
nr:MAG TPA: hypothetical protein [Caudoviricetes sp.]